MKSKPVLAVACGLGILAILLAGCSKDSPTVPASSGELNLTSQFGGYTATDEPAAFGDPEIETLMGEDPSADDPAFLQGEVDSLRGMRGATVYAMAIRWGMLKTDSTMTQTTDWSGSLALTHGFIHVVRTIRFELVQDYIVRPRPNRSTLEWVSFTSKSFDGLLLAIIVPPTPADSDWSNNQLSFQTGPYSRVFSLSELEHLNEIVDIGDQGNQIAFNAIDLNADSCGTGQLEGRWLLNPSHRNGHFIGKWMSDDGLLMGHLRGHFGMRPAGEKVFFGKYIGPAGHFRGLIRGTWDFDPADSTKGSFDGIFAERSGTTLGELHGQWGSVPTDSTAAVGHGRHGNGRDRDPKDDSTFGTNRWTPGFFSGQWAKTCSSAQSAASAP
jgi:hypothetical protein